MAIPFPVGATSRSRRACLSIRNSPLTTRHYSVGAPADGESHDQQPLDLRRGLLQQPFPLSLLLAGVGAVSDRKLFVVWPRVPGR